MRKIQPPLCICCRTARAEYESELWPSVMLCFKCARDLANRFVDMDVADGNPLVLELIRGWAEDFGYRFRIWRPSRYAAGAMSEVYIYVDSKNNKPESYTKTDNLLDNL